MSESNLPLLLTRSGTTLFCDDYRPEASGKLLIVGLFGDFLAIPKFPATVSLKCLVTLVTPFDRPFERLALRAYHDDKVLNEIVVPSERLGTRSKMSSPFHDLKGVSRVAIFRAAFHIDFLEILEPGALRVRAETESEVIPCGALPLLQQEEVDENDS